MHMEKMTGSPKDLLDNPSQIASKPENLPESLRTRHQDKIENVVGYSLMGSASPADSDTVPVSLPYKDQPGKLRCMSRLAP